MPEYNYLKGNKSDFPHIENVNTYKYDNSFDYGRFDAPQMELQVCTVPWDMGEAHIGNRTISGIGNVVYFETREKRDAWFDAIPDDECYRFTTKFKELHRSLEIDVPIPYDMCAKHNYLRVKYAKFANDDSPVMYEDENGLREWFWFVREVEFLAPNTTRLHLLDDAFQTWIYDINVSGMVLERGHAPMFDTRANEFLADPLNKNTYLLTEDVNYGQATQVRHIDALALNSGTMYACIATTANPNGNWGTKAGNTWKVPASAYYISDDCPSVFVFALKAEKLNSFLSSIENNYPQFKQTIQAVWFASSMLLTLSNSFSFAGVSCYRVSSPRKKINLTKLSKDLFAYDAKYADIAKLYTYPYAHIEVTDENGQVDVVKIEDSTGQIDVIAVMSLAYPFINIQAQLSGVGGDASASVSYRNVGSHTFTFDGQWYDTLRTWQVPTFAVVLEAATEYAYSSHFDRAQAAVDYTAAQNNAYANANTAVANTTLQTTANTAVTTRSNASADTSYAITEDYNNRSESSGNYIIDETATSTIQANEQQGAIAAGSGMATSVVSAVASGNPAQALAGIVNGLIGGASTLMSTNVSNGLTQAQATYAQASNTSNRLLSNYKAYDDTANQKSAASDITTINNTYSTAATANNAATTKANADRTASAAQSAIDNGIAQAALNAPSMFGTFANGDTASNKPIGLFAHVVTQSKSAIRAAGDEFMRYGYMLDGQWQFDGNWNVGKYFTYWKLKDFWVSNLNVPDMYMDKIRFFLFGGVTIWRRPEDIGHVSVYDNFNG